MICSLNDPRAMGVDLTASREGRYVEVAKSEDVHLYARCHQGYFRLLVLRNARRGVQCDGVPNTSIAGSSIPCCRRRQRGVGTINFEALGALLYSLVRPMS